MSAFRGVRILDCSQGLVGPMAAMLLADFEAEVIKVEPPGGDRAAAEPGYLMWNRNKARVTLDFADPGGLAEVKRLLAGADVAVFDHAPGVLEGLGLDAASLAAAHPRLIHLWTPPFGTTGDYADLPSHHGMLTGLMGAAFRQGSYRDQPTWLVMPMVHYGQAVTAAGAVGAALIERTVSGLGQAVVCSGLHGMSEVTGNVGFAGSPGMMGGGHPLGGGGSYRLYQCGDGQWLFLGALFHHFLARTAEALRRSDLPGLSMGIEHVFATNPRDVLVDLLKANLVPCAGVGERENWLASGPIAANDMRAELEHPSLGKVVMPGVAAKLSASPGTVRRLVREAGPEDLSRFAEPQPPADQGQRLPEPPLAGVKILDLGTVIAGAYTSAILASWGADVVKVEPAEGDPFRPYGAGFMNYNRGKRGLGIDLKSEAGRACFLEMAKGADVVIDNFRHGVRQRLGIDYEVLKAVNPAIISCSISCYGSKGAEAGLPGFDPLLQAWSGMMSAQGGGPDCEPVFHAVPVNDVATAAMGAFGVVAALHHRAMTGEGQDVETTLTAQSAIFQSADLVWYEGRPRLKLGCEDCLGFTALDRYYRAGDGWLCLGLTTEAQFAALAEVLGHGEWVAAFPNAFGAERDGLLAGEIEAALAGEARGPLLARLRAVGVPATPVMRGHEAQGQEWLWENRYYELSHHPYWGELLANRGYADFSRSPSGYTRAHPEMGEHGLEVLLEYGIDRDTIVKLAQERVIFRG